MDGPLQNINFLTFRFSTMGKKNKKNKANSAAPQANKRAGCNAACSACNGVEDEIPPPLPPPENEQISVNKPPTPMSRQLKQEVMQLVNQLLESRGILLNYSLIRILTIIFSTLQ